MVTGDPTFEAGQIGRGVIVRRRHRGQLWQRRRVRSRGSVQPGRVDARRGNLPIGRLPEARRRPGAAAGSSGGSTTWSSFDIQRWAARLTRHADVRGAGQRDPGPDARAAAAGRLESRRDGLRRFGQGGWPRDLRQRQAARGRGRARRAQGADRAPTRRSRSGGRRSARRSSGRSTTCVSTAAR